MSNKCSTGVGGLLTICTNPSMKTEGGRLKEKAKTTAEVLSKPRSLSTPHSPAKANVSLSFLHRGEFR